MRVIALLCFAGAIGLGLVWPWAQLNFMGREVATLSFGNLQGPVVERRIINLSEADNPVRVRFFATYKVAGLLPPVKLPIKVVLTDKDGTLLTGVVSFPTQARDTGPEQKKVRAGTELNFNIINTGQHEFFLELAPNTSDGGVVNPALDSIAARVIANAPQINNDYKALAAVLALAGFYLLVRSRGRKKKNGDARSALKKPRRWGRGE